MGGLTTNSDILKAINQVIVAINDLELSCTPEITVRPNITVNCSCTGSGGGTDLPLDGDSPLIDPPPGYVQKQVDDDACKRAYWNYDGLYAVIKAFYDGGIVSMINISIDLIVAAIGLIFGKELAVVGAIGGATGVKKVAGYVSNILLALLFGVDLALIMLHLTQTKDDIVCAFYNFIVDGTRPPNDIIDEMIGILSDNGLPGPEIALIRAVYITNWASTLLHDVVDETGINKTGEALAAYTGGSAGCGGCGNNSPMTLSPFCSSVAGEIIEQGQNWAIFETRLANWACNPAWPQQIVIIKFVDGVVRPINLTKLSGSPTEASSTYVTWTSNTSAVFGQITSAEFHLAFVPTNEIVRVKAEWS
jgi:hypothetical protein